MRLGIYDPYLDDLGGGEKYMLTVAESLAKDHTVSIFWDNKEDYEILNKRFGFSLETVSLEKNIFAPNISLLQKLAATQKYDVIIALSDGSIPMTLSKKLFLHVQQPLNTVSSSSIYGKLKLSRVSGVFYNSEFTESFNRSKFPGVKSLVIYPPVEIFPEKMKRENVILHVGRFRVRNVIVGDYKKQSFMVEMFKKMYDQHKLLKDWKFILAVSVKDSDKEQFAKLQHAAKGYPIEFVLNKNNKELWNVYNKTKIYWHASGYGEDLVKHPDFAEHFGITTVEAMGAGAVPVVINAGGQKEIIKEGENGYLWDTEEECIKKTIKLMEHSDTLHKLSHNAQLRAKDFSKEKFAERIKSLITQ